MTTIYVNNPNKYIKNIKIVLIIFVVLLLAKKRINVDSFVYFYFKTFINI